MYRLFMLFCSMSLSGQGLGGSVPDYPAEKLSANTYVIHGPIGFPSPENKGFMNNPVFTVTQSGVVVIDPGSSLYTGEMVIRQISKITKKPVTHVFSTHVHGDHWLGNHAFKKAFPKVNFIAHPIMIEQAKAGAGSTWVKRMSLLTKGATDGTKAIIPGTPIESSELVIGGIRFRSLAPKQAHSGTDIMIHIVEEGVLVLGDNVTNQRIGLLDEATFRGNIKACDVALTTGAKIFVPGHGPAGDREVVENYRSYLTTIFNTASTLLEDGLSDFEMKPKIVAKLKRFHKWDGFEDQIGKHVSLAMLEAEKAMFE